MLYCIAFKCIFLYHRDFIFILPHCIVQRKTHEGLCTENDEKLKCAEDDERLKCAEDDERLKCAEDDERLKCAEDDEPDVVDDKAVLVGL